MKNITNIIGCGLATVTLSGAGIANAEQQKPNFVFFLIDDLGWADIGCYGSSLYDTPNIDRLAAEGMRFTDAYAASPVCGPTRNSIMSGRYPARTGRTHAGSGMAADEFTLAEALKEGGYRTFFAGKWHLGHGADTSPEGQGFDINKGGGKWGQPPSFFAPYHLRTKGRQVKGLPPFYFEADVEYEFDTAYNKKKSGTPLPGLEDAPEGEYLTKRLTAESLKFLDQHGKSGKPFLLYLSHYTVHAPLQAEKALIDKYTKKIADNGVNQSIKGISRYKQLQMQNNPIYAAMVESMDESVGQVIDKLKELGVDDNTVVVFMSDNGGLSTSGRFRGPTSNLPLRAGKANIYEGGIREPLIIKWPGTTKAGSISSELVISTDFYPTFLEMAGLPPRTEQHQDGVSLVPLLKGSQSLERDALYWHFPHSHSAGGIPSGAVRVGDYKLVEFFKSKKVELYNLRDDIGERVDLAESKPEIRQKLYVKLKQWHSEINPEIAYGESKKTAKKKIAL